MWIWIIHVLFLLLIIINVSHYVKRKEETYFFEREAFFEALAVFWHLHFSFFICNQI